MTRRRREKNVLRVEREVDLSNTVRLKQSERRDTIICNFEVALVPRPTDTIQLPTVLAFAAAAAHDTTSGVIFQVQLPLPPSRHRAAAEMLVLVLLLLSRRLALVPDQPQTPRFGDCCRPC